MSERLIYEDTDKRIYVVTEATEASPQVERYEWATDTPEKALRSIVRDQLVADKVRSGTLDNAIVASIAAIFEPWQPDQQVQVGDLRWWDGTAVECIQAHTTQADWTPDATPALWKIYRDPDAEVPAEWVQPTGAHDAYAVGDRVTFEGQVWESVIDANVWSPTAYPAGWTLIG